MHAFPHATSMLSLDGRLVHVNPNTGMAANAGSPQPSPTATAAPERRFVCNEPGCGKRFNRKFTLKEHTKTHTGARPYACDYEGCSASFSTSGNLSRHKFTHTGEKPFGCTFEMCYKRFCTKEKLARHTKTHSGIRPFTCKVDGCNKRFSTSGNLGRHLKTHRDPPNNDNASPRPSPSSWTGTDQQQPALQSSPSTSSSRSSHSSASSPFEELSSAAIDEHIISVLRYDAKMVAASRPPAFRAPAVSLQRSHSDFVQNRPHHHGHQHNFNHAPLQQGSSQPYPYNHVNQHNTHPQAPLQIAIPSYTHQGVEASSGRLTFNMVDSPPAQWNSHLENAFPTKFPPRSSAPPSSIPEYEPLPFDTNGANAQPKLGRSVSEGAFFNLWL